MATFNVQVVLAHIYRRPDLRVSLAAGDVSPLAAFELTSEETESVLSLVRDQRSKLEHFAEALTKKRILRLQSFFPLLGACIGDKRWRLLLDDYCRKVPIVPGADREDAIAFFCHLEHSQAFADLTELHLRDLGAIEAGFARAGQPHALQYTAENTCRVADFSRLRVSLDPSASITALNHDPTLLLEWARSGGRSSVAASSELVHVVFFPARLQRRSHLLARISGLLARILGRADGRSSISMIAAEECGDSMSPEFVEALEGTVEHFLDKGVLVCMTEET